MSEGEEERDIVECDSFNGATATSADEQQNHVLGLEVLSGEYSIFGGSKERKILLYDVRDQSNSKADPQADHCRRVPGVWRHGEGQCCGEQKEHATMYSSTDPIDPSDFLGGADFGVRCE